MREKAKDKGRIEDIIEFSKNVIKITDGVSFDVFSEDILIYYATMKNIEIVGEAAYMLTKEFKALHTDIPWPQIEGMRHVLVHGYSQVVPRILWGTAIESIPMLLGQAEKCLMETDWEEWCNS